MIPIWNGKEKLVSFLRLRLVADKMVSLKEYSCLKPL
jgi:hypothetical protein